ncbi:MAG: hypothetical protein PWP38_1301, partial [Clostridiales bacterium]|nr:hypothetical protein [Clostridiales bacterium]
QNEIVAYYRERILSEQFEQGEKLPTVRSLASALSVSPLTVTRAYNKLADEQLVRIVQGSGTFVMTSPVHEHVNRDSQANRYDWMLTIDDNLRRTQFAAAFSVEHLTKGYNMFTSLMYWEEYPYRQIRQLLDKIVEEHPEILFQYSPVSGDTIAKRAVADYLQHRGNFKVRGAEVMITSGSQQALNIIARTFIKPGDTVLMETPTFPGAIDAFQNQGCTICSIPMEADGIDITLLEQAVEKHRPKLLYLTPNLNNPTGIVTSDTKREMILDVAKNAQMLIVEDDPWSELIDRRQPFKLLKAYDPDGHVILVKGFSKLVGPGFRVGAVIAQGTVLNRLITAKANADLGSPLLTQRLLAEIVATGLLEQTAEKLKVTIKEKQALLMKTLQSDAPEYLKWQMPDGGVNLWLTLPAYLNTDTFLKAYCHPNNLTMLTGRLCYPNEPMYNQCRMSFSALKKNEIEPAVKLFCQLLKNYHSDYHRDTINPL